MGFQKGQGGRPKGAKNKFQADVAAMVQKALADEGGVKYLRGLAADEPRAFAVLLGKLMPQHVEAEHSGEIVLRWKGEE